MRFLSTEPVGLNQDIFHGNIDFSDITKNLYNKQCIYDCWFLPRI